MTKKILSPKAAVPILLITFIFSLIIDNGFKFMALAIQENFHLSASSASLQATLTGIIIGIGAVVYAALADSFSIRRLLIVGLILTAVGSIIGFVGQSSWSVVLTGRIIQTAGLAAAETLYVIYVTKHLPEKDQKTYLGFSTSAFQLAILFGTLSSGFIATYISWTAMFLLSCLALVAIPFVAKKVPEEESTRSHLDILGLFYITVVSTAAMLFLNTPNLPWLLLAVVALVFFIVHVIRNPRALVRPEFFKNWRYVFALITVAIIYSTQMGITTLVVPYAVHHLHGMNLDVASLLMAPGYATGALLGALSGRVARVLNSRQTMYLALSMIVLAMVLIAALIDGPLWVIVLAIVLFSGGFATMYAPLVNSALSTIPAAKSGIAIGFYNLTINIAIPAGIGYTAKLIDLSPNFLGFLSSAHGAEAEAQATVCWILVIIGVVGALVYVISDAILARSERAHAAQPAPTE
ncbi:MFS transporter [Corynebacterium uropygiale]|uniref:MFS transporter n=1 Tax=Corynebacterium uropygiale TaxID=1775911 RepID=A0A9X1U0D6_9CORY|nr:MFS transporter [Corynebacterium uropygiale]MCF4006363.1 MFS transporter [Corynebacterium uropygiale]